jgi:hypothetical protein
VALGGSCEEDLASLHVVVCSAPLLKAQTASYVLERHEMMRVRLTLVAG